MDRFFGIVSIAFLFFCSATLLAQHQHEHSSTSQGLIDGAIHPELVPDTAAYRLYLLSVAMDINATPQDVARQHSHLARIGLKDDDLQSMTKLLVVFRARYDNLINDYNKAATAAARAGTQPDIKAFLRQRDGLVEGVRGALKAALSPEGLVRFDAHVQGEKRGMKVAPGEAQ